jgi:hypothetical protein
MQDSDHTAVSFDVAEVADRLRYCGPCAAQTDSRVLTVRPTSNGVADGQAYWEAEVWECKVCGHGGQMLRPLHVTRARHPARLA